MPVQELTFRVNFDPAVATAEMRRFTSSVASSLQQVGLTEKQQAAASISLQRQRSSALISQFKQEEREAARTAQARLREESKALRQKIAEENRAAREVARINAETARQAAAQERLRERAAKQLADVQIREAKRAARELEKSLAASRSSGGGGALFGAIAGNVPGVGNLAAQFTSVSSAASAAGGSVAAFAVPVAAATVGVAALTAGAILLAKTLFDTTKAAAEFEGKFRDLSQQVGVSAESLSTLDFFASTTGGNIETVTASLAIFQKHLEAAHDPTSKEAKLLKELGVTSLDTETALRQTVTGLFKLGEGSKQTTAALELFGRSGRFMNAITKEAGGNFDEAGKQAAKFGRLVTTEGAIAADQFNDSLVILNGVLASIGRQLVSDTIPVFILLFQEISAGLSGNKEAWKSWSGVIEAEVAGVIATLKAAAQFIASRGTLDFGILFEENLRGIREQAKKLRAEIFFQSQIEFGQRITAQALAGRPGDRLDAGKAASEAQARANKDIQLQQQALEELTRFHREGLETERQKDLKSIEEWKTVALDIEANRLAGQQSIFEQERENARRFIKNKEDLSLALREIDQKDQKAQNEFLTAVTRIRDEANKRIAQSELDLNRQLFDIRETERQGELARIKAALDAKEILESEAIRREQALLKQAHEDRLILINLELGQITTSAARKIELDNEKIKSEQRFTDEFKRLTNERIRAMQKEAAEQTPRPGGRVPEDQQVPIDIGEPPEPDAEGWEDFADSIEQTIVPLNEILAGSFLQVADAIGSVVQQWVLYGETGPAVMRKILAAALASIAAEAAVNAIKELALGFGSLFFHPAKAAAHFTSAALWGAIAGGTAIAGRAVAGDTFKQKGNGSGGSGTGSDRPNQLDPLRLERNTGQRELIVRLKLEQHVQSNDSHIVKTIVKDFQSGGDTREVFNSDGVKV